MAHIFIPVFTVNFILIIIIKYPVGDYSTVHYILIYSNDTVPYTVLVHHIHHIHQTQQH